MLAMKPPERARTRPAPDPTHEGMFESSSTLRGEGRVRMGERRRGLSDEQ